MSGYLPDTHRPLPQSPDAEQGLLCSILLSPDSVLHLCEEEGIDGGSFYNPVHATIYRAAKELWDDRKPMDLIVITNTLRDQSRLDQVGGASFLTNLFTFVATAANARHYATIVKEKAALRNIITNCTECAALAFDNPEDVDAFTQEVEKKIFSATERKQASDEKSTRETVMDVIESMAVIHDKGGGLTGLTTGFTDLDNMTGGLNPAEVFVIAGRTSMGKTALAMQIAEHAAIDSGVPVGVFSLEMSKQQILQRAIMSKAMVDWVKFRNGYASQSDFTNITASANAWASAPVQILEKQGIQVNYMAAVARRWARQFGIKLLVIDYVQLLKGAKSYKGDNRSGEVAEISGAVKALAKELNIPIILLAQLNRNVESRSGAPRPRLSDLKESGSLEQDADIVGLIHREEYYARSQDERDESRGKADLIIAKQRNGPTGDIKLTFLSEFTRFEDRILC